MKYRIENPKHSGSKQPRADLRTIRGWSEEFGVAILDPDGFNRTLPDLNERFFTRDEFLEAMLWSTVG